MSKIMVEVEVSKEAYELGSGAARIIKAVKDAVDDGWQMGQDLPVVVGAVFAEMAAIEGVDKISDEMKEDPAAFGKAVALGVSDIYGVFKKPDAPVA